MSCVAWCVALSSIGKVRLITERRSSPEFIDDAVRLKRWVLCFTPPKRKAQPSTSSMFERIEPLFVEYSDEYADYERAVDLSERGQHADAVKLFRKVSRRAPELAAELGI